METKSPLRPLPREAALIVNAHSRKGQDLFAQSQHANMYAAIDELVSKLDRLVEKYKQKTQAVHAIPTGQMLA